MKYSVTHRRPSPGQAPFLKAFFKVTLNCNSAGKGSTESPSFLPKITQPIGQKAGRQDPSYPTTKGLTHPFVLPHHGPTTPFQSPPKLSLQRTQISCSVQNPAWPSWKPLTSSLCFPNHCPRSDPFLPEPPPSPQSDPHVMKGINMAKPPAQPSSFPAAPARPLID